MTDYNWKPIEPLSEDERAIDLLDIEPLYDSWRLARQRLEESSSASFKGFEERLIRRLSVETGILERLYDLDRGTTEALVANGFSEELVSRASTDIEPSRLIDLLRDQEAAVQLVVDCIAGSREVTKGTVHELHAILTQHQETTTAIDQFGNRLEIPLLKGRFKEQPNNPRRRDGSVHEYCPPLQVESEMDNLLRWFSEYGNEDPIIAASWLHHRFTQIHPYQDGNGRVARALTTLALLQSDLLPLVIDRDLRSEYIKALEQADFGDLTDLATLLARLERAAILEALSVDVDAELSHERTLTSAVIESLAAKFARRRQDRDAELRAVNSLAKEMRSVARSTIESVLRVLEGPLSEFGPPDVHIMEGGPDRQNSHWYKFEVISSAKAAGKFVNFDEEHYFIKATVRAGTERLVFVTSLHHVGRELSGIMEATAFAQLEAYEGSATREYSSQDFFLTSLEPFVVTNKTRLGQVQEAFERWLDTALAVAIKEYGDRL